MKANPVKAGDAKLPVYGLLEREAPTSGPPGRVLPLS
jgi:hypothetical protein